MKSYLPGTWYAVFSDEVTVVLPSSEKERVAAVWSLVDAGAGFDAVLDALLAGGLSSLSGFGLIGESHDNARALCRGNVRATFDTGNEQVVVDGTGAATWQEGNAEAVRGITIEMDAEATGTEDLLIGAGLVRVSRVSSPAARAESTPPAGTDALTSAPAPVVEPAAPAEPVEPERDSFVPVAVASSFAPAPPVAPVSAAAPQFGLVDPIPDPLTAPQVPDAPAHDWVDPLDAPAPFPAADEPTPFEPTPFEPTSHQSEVDPVGSSFAPPAPVSEATIAPDDVPMDIPAPGGQVVARLRLSTGESIDVDRAILLGRAPEARRYQVGDEPRIVVVPSPNQEISSTHLEIRPGTGADHGSAVVTDLGSTNGTVIVQPGLGPEELQAGVAVQLIPGAIVDLGDNLTIQVTSA